MALASKAELRAAWQRLARRNRWTLVDDEEAFLSEAEAACAELGDSKSPAAQAEVAVLRTYGRHLYDHLIAGDNRGAEELRAFFFWRAIKKKWPHADAEDIAMEGMVRAITRLRQLRSPESIFVWRLRVFQTAQQVLIDQRGGEVPMPTNAEGEELDLPDPQSMVEVVEQRALVQEFFDILRASPLDDLDRDIVFRSYVYGEKPGQIAAAYGMKDTYIRVRKCRALNVLRKDVRLVQLLRELTTLFRGASEGAGGGDDES